MRELSYLKLFEAFESEKLTKTLAFISSNEDKNKFISQLKKICYPIDFPLSKLNDNYFEYLPFRKALKKVCDTNIGNITYIKFWFDGDGKFITTTAVDGIDRGCVLIGRDFSKVIDKYDIVKEFKTRDNARHELKNGDIISIDMLNGLWVNDVIAYVYLDPRDKCLYAIQDMCVGSTPDSDGWISFSKYSWRLTGDDFKNIRLLKPKGHTDENLYGMNGDLDITHMSIDRLDINKIANAQFAIVMDFNKIISSEYVKKSHISNVRKTRKENTKLTINNDDIKKQNIERYMNKISDGR